VRHDAEKTAENERGDAKRLIAVDQALEPIAVGSMAFGILAVRVDENVNVEKPDDASP
jgi:hypothetical protein